jgi:hypothetical protein
MEGYIMKAMNKIINIILLLCCMQSLVAMSVDTGSSSAGQRNDPASCVMRRLERFCAEQQAAAASKGQFVSSRYVRRTFIQLIKLLSVAHSPRAGVLKINNSNTDITPYVHGAPVPGLELKDLYTYKETIHGLYEWGTAFSKYYTNAFGQNEIHKFNLDTQTGVVTLKKCDEQGHPLERTVILADGDISSIAVSTDGHYVVLDSAYKKTLILWEFDENEYVCHHEDITYDLGNLDSHFVAIRRENGDLVLWRHMLLGRSPAQLMHIAAEKIEHLKRVQSLEELLAAAAAAAAQAVEKTPSPDQDLEDRLARIEMSGSDEEAAEAPFQATALSPQDDELEKTDRLLAQGEAVVTSEEPGASSQEQAGSSVADNEVDKLLAEADDLLGKTAIQ